MLKISLRALIFEALRNAIYSLVGIKVQAMFKSLAWQRPAPLTPPCYIEGVVKYIELDMRS